MAITLKDLTELRQQVAESRKKLEEQERALIVLEQMLVSQPSQIPAPAPVSAPAVNLGELELAPSGQQRETLPDQIRSLRNSFGVQEFSVAHVEAALNKIGKPVAGKSPRARIAMILSELENSGEVIRTFRGTGSVPHKFKFAEKGARSKEPAPSQIQDFLQ